jgi:tripartite-type tricarboxylate transporter receptor subunit TctC
MPERSAARLVLTVAAVCCIIAVAGAAHAQSSNRPIRLVLPYTAGSPNDVLARMIAPPLSARLGQTVVVDNRPGGGTSIGVSAVLNAEPDGTTLLFSNSPSHLIAPTGHAGFTYDPLKDFVPVAAVATSSNVIVIANSVPAATVREFVAYAKANAGKLNFGFGQGTLPQLVGEMFKAAAGIDLFNVPYKGGAQAVTDMIGGRVHMISGTAATLLPLHRAGKLKIIGYTGTARSPAMPDVPTMRESGYPEMISITYFGLFARADVPADIVSRINAEVNAVLASPEVRDGMTRLDFEPMATSSQEFAAVLAAEAPKWTAIAKAVGFQM